jgi:hypothetical protein
MKSESHPLVVSLDAITNSKEIDSESREHLKVYRQHLVEALEADRKKEAARLALQIASFVKFLYDVLLN